MPGSKIIICLSPSSSSTLPTPAPFSCLIPSWLSFLGSSKAAPPMKKKKNAATFTPKWLLSAARGTVLSLCDQSICLLCFFYVINNNYKHFLSTNELFFFFLAAEIRLGKMTCLPYILFTVFLFQAFASAQRHLSAALWRQFQKAESCVSIMSVLPMEMSGVIQWESDW